MKIGQFEIGKNHPVFIIAEAGVNHNGDIATAKKLVDVAKEAGASTVKFHAYVTDEIYVPEAELPEYVKKNMGESKSYYQMAEDLELSFDQLAEIKKYCDEAGIMFGCTPYGKTGIEWMEALGCEYYKIGSTHLTCWPMLEDIAKLKKPIILSSGMGEEREIESALCILKEHHSKIALLHCTTNYPCPLDEVNLGVLSLYRSIPYIIDAVGYSDHTEGIIIPALAALFGARIIEKHITLDRKMPGPDHRASLEPGDLKKMVEAIRFFERDAHDFAVDVVFEVSAIAALTVLRDTWGVLTDEIFAKYYSNVPSCSVSPSSIDQLKDMVYMILGNYRKQPTASEKRIRYNARTSIVAAVDIPKGTIIKRDMLKYCRPGTGLSPTLYKKIWGGIARVDIPKNTMIAYEHVFSPSGHPVIRGLCEG